MHLEEIDERVQQSASAQRALEKQPTMFTDTLLANRQHGIGTSKPGDHRIINANCGADSAFHAKVTCKSEGSRRAAVRGAERESRGEELQKVVMVCRT
eukprot:2346454-Rhodomonas_salina.3